MKVLVVEDEKDMLEGIVKYLSMSNFMVDDALNYLTGSQKINDNDYEVAIIDVNLPDGLGLDLINELKQVNPKTGIIIVSARSSVDDRIRGLELGADDYVTKPFHLPELVARINALVRRKYFDASNSVTCKEITIDLLSGNVLVNNEPINLSRKEYELLLFFMSNVNRVLTKISIHEHLWPNEADLGDYDDLLYAQIKNLRKKLAEKGGKNRILTVYGLGYKFTDDEITE